MFLYDQVVLRRDAIPFGAIKPILTRGKEASSYKYYISECVEFKDTCLQYDLVVVQERSPINGMTVFPPVVRASRTNPL